MTSTARAHSIATRAPGSLPGLTGVGREVSVVARDPLVAEALAVALSTCGVAARAAISLPWRGRTRSSSDGAAIVVLGGLDHVTARRTVAALIGAGRRVALIGGGWGDAAGDCLEMGAEVLIPPSVSLGDLASVIASLGAGGTTGAPGVAQGEGASPEVAAARTRLAMLTRREQEILASLMAGRRAAAIARRDFVSLHTVRTQIRSLLRKLDVHSQVEAVAAAHRAGWAPPVGGA